MHENLPPMIKIRYMKFIKFYRNSNDKTELFSMKQKDEEAL